MFKQRIYIRWFRCATNTDLKLFKSTFIIIRANTVYEKGTRIYIGFMIKVMTNVYISEGWWSIIKDIGFSGSNNKIASMVMSYGIE